MIRRGDREAVEKDKNVHSIRFYHVLFCIGALLALLAVMSFSARDVSIMRGGIESSVENWIGKIGAVFSVYLLLGFGFAGYILVLIYQIGRASCRERVCLRV